MTETQKLLDRAREMCSPTTDYQLAKRLRVSRSRLSQWRTGKTTPDNEVAWKIAKLLGLPITDVIAYFEKDRATTPAKRAFWDAQLPRVLSALAIAVALCSSATGGSLSAENRSYSPSFAFDNLYIMRSSRRWLATWWATLKTLTRCPALASAAA